MDHLPFKRFYGGRYRQLFIAIIALYLLKTFFNINQITEFLINLSLTITIILAIRTFPLSKKIKLIFRLLICCALTLTVVRLFVSDLTTEKTLDILGTLVYAFFIGLSSLFLNRKIFLSKTVDKDTLLGGISIYLLLGIFWYLIYRVLYLLNENSFSISLEKASNYPHHLLYFSFTTLTTLGYGDISPISRMAMGFSNIEAIIGQLYPAVFLARLVSLYTVSEIEDS